MDIRDVGPLDVRDAAVDAGPPDAGGDAEVCENYGGYGPCPGRLHSTFWALNFYEAGLIDEEGHVIPGDPVIDPPTPDD